MYWLKMVSSEALKLHDYFARTSSRSKDLTFAALLGGLAAILQSAGGNFPGIGYLISPMATAPIVLGMIYSIRNGLSAYVLAIVILMLLQPSELIVFPFTTGLFGLGLGWGFIKLNKRISIVASGSFILLAGISILLYGLRFPVLGPSMSSSFHFQTFVYVFVFCLLYSWLWTEMSLAVMRKYLRAVDP